MNDYDRPLAGSTSPHRASNDWWRWPLMPPAALIGAILGTVLVGVLQWFGMKLSGVYNEHGWYFEYILPLVMWGCFGCFLTGISYRVAPTGKLIASTVMATAFCVVMVLVVLFGFARDTPSLGAGVQVILSLGALISGAIFGIVQARDE